MRHKSSDYSCIPLCMGCHTMARGAYHIVGGREFERRFNLDIWRLVARLNYNWWNQWKVGVNE